MIMTDMHREQAIAEVFLQDGQCTWQTYTYDEHMQVQCDRRFAKRVSPGHGSISQEMWVAAPLEYGNEKDKSSTSYSPLDMRLQFLNENNSYFFSRKLMATVL